MSVRVDCPQCGGTGIGEYVPAEEVGSQQPGEWQPCALCFGKTKIDVWYALRWLLDAIDEPGQAETLNKISDIVDDAARRQHQQERDRSVPLGGRRAGARWDVN